MFDGLRHFAYRHVSAFKKEGNAFDAWREHLVTEAHGLNVFATPVSESDVREIAERVATWTWQRFSEERPARQYRRAGKV